MNMYIYIYGNIYIYIYINIYITSDTKNPPKCVPKIVKKIFIW